MSWLHIKYYDIHFYTPSSFEHRTHKLCKLPNDLLTLLISDPTETTSGCSLTIATGSHNDPSELPGLAHLCEHMILAGGSKKFSDPGIYHEAIARNNGSQNAFTTGEQTAFFFELPSSHNSDEISFDHLLGIFSSFFAEPLFHPSSINKEIYAIESEHNANVSSTSKILYHATRLLANRSHPFHRFATGNLLTLKNLPQAQPLNVRNMLQEYFNAYYISTKMTLCIRGPQSINTLAKLAVTEFGNLPRQRSLKRSLLGTVRSPMKCPMKPLKSATNEPLNDMNPGSRILWDAWKDTYSGVLCFSENEEENTIFVKSHKHPIARLIFPVPSQSTRFTRRDIIAFAGIWLELFGDESEGSLCHFLVENGWITSCCTSTNDFATGNLGLILELSLTNMGRKEIKSVLETVVSLMIPFCREKGVLALAKSLSDQYCIDLLRFIYLPKEDSPMEECSNLSGLLQEDLEALDPKYIFKGSPIIVRDSSNPMLLFEESEESERSWVGQAIKFQAFLKEFMTSNKMRLILLGDAAMYFPFRDEIKKDMRDVRWTIDDAYGFEYFKCKFDFSTVKGNILLDTNFHFPRQNTYIPKWANRHSNLTTVLTTSSDKSRFAALNFAISNDLIQSIPQLVSRNAYHEMWVLPNDVPNGLKFKSIVSLDILSLSIKPSPVNTMNLEILIQMLSIALSSDLYPSLKLGYSYELACSTKGEMRISLTLCGFSDGLKNFLVAIIETIRNIAIDPNYPSKELFRRARVSVRSSCEDAANENCVNVASIGLLVLLEKNIWTLEDRMDALENIDMDSFKVLCMKFFRSSKYLNLLIQGDISPADEINRYLSRRFTNHLRKDAKEEKDHSASRSTKFLEPGNAYAKHWGPKDDPNNGIVYFVQTGYRENTRTLTMTVFTAFLLSFSMIPILRNEKQIGYVVIGGTRLLCDTVGVHITVMSEGPCIDLENHINEYFAYVEENVLNKLDANQFHDKYLKPYIDIHSRKSFDKLRKISGPANLSNEIAPNVQNGDYSVLNSPAMKRHKKLKNQILDSEYGFQNEEIAIDLDIIRCLTLSEYKRFYEEIISIHSVKRRKISIMVASPMGDEELANRRMISQLDRFLRFKGLAIEPEEIRRIVENSKGKTKPLVKELYQYFKNKSEARKLLSALLREIGTVVLHGIRPRRRTSPAWNARPAMDLKSIDDVKMFKAQLNQGTHRAKEAPVAANSKNK